MSGCGGPPAGRVFLVRHGETEWSRSGRHTGRTDVPLTARGATQAARVGALLAGRRFVLVATSPRVRAAHTADLAGFILAAEPSKERRPVGTVDCPAGWPAATTPLVDRRETWPDLAEWDYGEYEGITTREIRRTVPGWMVWSSPVPGGERADQVAARADAVLTRVTPYLDQGDVALFGHSHMLRVLIARWLRMPPTAGASFVLDPAGVSELGHEHENRTLMRLNECPQV